MELTNEVVFTNFRHRGFLVSYPRNGQAITPQMIDLAITDQFGGVGFEEIKRHYGNRIKLDWVEMKYGKTTRGKWKIVNVSNPQF